mgnify:CR=1 FL=1
MNRKEILRIIDDLETIEDFGKKYNPHFKITMKGGWNSNEEVTNYFEGIDISLTSEGTLVIQLQGAINNVPWYWAVWGEIRVKIEDKSLLPDESFVLDYLKILDYVVNKIHKNEIKIKRFRV